MKRWIEARYKGKCACGQSFARHTVISYDSDARRVIQCPRCNPAQSALGPSDRATGDYSDIAYEDQCASACGLDSLSARDL